MKKEKYTYTFEDFSTTDLKKLSNKELENFSSAIRQYIIESCAKNGGHLSSNLGVVELTVALHKAFDFEKDKLIFDVGHQSYTHKVLTGRSLDNLRKENGVDGFQKRSESKYDNYEAGHSSTSLSAAMGMALKRDLDEEDYNVISVIGDSSLTNGMVFEALNNMNNFDHKIIVIINDNNMSITQPVGALHDVFQHIRLSSSYKKAKERYQKIFKNSLVLRPFYIIMHALKNFFKSLLLRNNMFEMCGFHYIGNVDGYNFHDMERAFKKAKKLKNSVIIHVLTTKGKGYSFSENDDECKSKYHSVKPFDVKTGLPINKKEESHFYNVFSQLLDEELENNKKAILVNPGTTFGSDIYSLLKKYPNQVFDFGISEEHIATFASGFSIDGYKSYISIYSTFMQRSYDQIIHDIARMDLPVTILVDRAGLVGPDGETHQGIYDESFLIDMPNMNVAMPKNESEAKKLFNFQKTFIHPLAIRLPLDPLVEDKDAENIIELGKWFIEKKSTSNKLCVISFGPKLIKIKKFLDVNNLDVSLINALWIEPFDINLIKNYIMNFENIIIYDPYATKDGFTMHLYFELDKNLYKGNKHFISIDKTFVQKGTIEEQEKRCNVDLETLFSKIKSIL